MHAVWLGCAAIIGGCHEAFDLTEVEPPSPCDTSAPFGTPIRVPVADRTANDGGARFGADELTMYFHTGLPGQLRVAVRANVSAPFRAPVPLTATLPYSAFNVTLPDDARFLVFEGYESDVEPPQLMIARAEGAGYASPARVEPGASAGNAQPYLAGSTLWFSSNRNGLYEPFRVELGQDGSALGEPQRAAESTTPVGTSACCPVISRDGLTLFFASSRAPSEANDIWVVERSTSDVAFGPPNLVSEVNSRADDFPSWISPDGCRLYLSSHRDGDNYDIWVSRRGD